MPGIGSGNTLFNFHFQALTRPHHGLVSLMLLFVSVSLTGQHLGVGDYVDAHSRNSNSDSNSNSINNITISGSDGNGNWNGNENGSRLGGWLFVGSLVFGVQATLAHVLRLRFYAWYLKVGRRGGNKVNKSQHTNHSNTTDTLLNNHKSSTTTAAAAAGYASDPADVVVATDENSRTVRFKTPSAIPLPSVSHSVSASPVPIDSLQSTTTNHPAHPKPILYDPSSISNNNNSLSKINSTATLMAIANMQSNQDLTLLLQSAQNQSTIWRSMHLTRSDAKRAWKFCFVLLALTIVSTVSFTALNTAAIIVTAQANSLSLQMFGEGLARASIASFFGLLSLYLLVLDTMSFIRAFRIAYTRLYVSDPESALGITRSIPNPPEPRILSQSPTQPIHPPSSSPVNLNTTATSSTSSSPSLSSLSSTSFRGPPVDLMHEEDVMLGAMFCGLIVYINVTSAVFMKIEGWSFRNAEQWYISSITTLGFGQVHIQKSVSKVLIVFFNTGGIVIVGMILSALGSKLTGMIRNFLLRGIREVRQKAASRKKRIAARRRLRMRRKLEERERLRREGLQRFQESTLNVGGEMDDGGAGGTVRGSLIGRRWGSSTTWHGSTETGKLLAQVGIQISGKRRGSHAETEDGKEAGGIVSRVYGSVGGSDVSDKPLNRIKSESALQSLFGIDVKGKAAAAAAAGISASPLSERSVKKVVEDSLRRPSTATSAQDSSLISAAMQRVSLGNSDDNVSIAPVPTNQTASSTTGNESLVIPNVSYPAQRPLLTLPHNSPISPIMHKSDSMQQHDVGLPLWRTETVDSTTEAALNLGYSIDDLADHESDDDGDGGQNTLDARGAQELMRQLQEARRRAVAGGASTSSGVGRRGLLNRSRTIASELGGGGLGGSRGRHFSLASMRGLLGKRTKSFAGGFADDLNPREVVSSDEEETAGTILDDDGGVNDFESEAVTDEEGLEAFSTGAESPTRPISVASDLPSSVANHARTKKFSLSRYLQRIHTWLEYNADTVAVCILIPLVLFGGAALFMLAEKQWDYMQGFYFNYSLITTTGYGDIYPESGWGKTLVIVMVFIGLGSWAYAVSTVVARFQADRVDVMAKHIHEERVARKRQASAEGQQIQSHEPDGKSGSGRISSLLRRRGTQQ